MMTVSKRNRGRPRKQNNPARFFSASTNFEEASAIYDALKREDPNLSDEQLNALVLKFIGYKSLLDLKRHAKRLTGKGGRAPEIQDSVLLADIAWIYSNGDLERARKLVRKICGYSDDYVAEGRPAPIVEKLARAGLSQMGFPHSHTFRHKVKAAQKHLS